MSDSFMDEKKREYTDLSTVESRRNDLAMEEFPEGPYGMNLETESLGKSSPWRDDQRAANPFGYENRQLHEGLPRVFPPDHHTHDEPDEEDNPQYGS